MLESERRRARSDSSERRRTRAESCDNAGEREVQSEKCQLPDLASVTVGWVAATRRQDLLLAGTATVSHAKLALKTARYTISLVTYHQPCD